MAEASEIDWPSPPPYEHSCDDSNENMKDGAEQPHGAALQRIDVNISADSTARSKPSRAPHAADSDQRLLARVFSSRNVEQNAKRKAMYRIRCSYGNGVSNSMPDWEVERCYSQILSVHSEVLQQGGMLPKMPPKYFFSGSDSEKVVQERLHALPPIIAALSEAVSQAAHRETASKFFAVQAASTYWHLRTVLQKEQENKSVALRAAEDVRATTQRRCTDEVAKQEAVCTIDVIRANEELERVRVETEQKIRDANDLLQRVKQAQQEIVSQVEGTVLNHEVDLQTVSLKIASITRSNPPLFDDIWEAEHSNISEMMIGELDEVRGRV